MKRILTITFALLISVLANAQIQTKFWGLELSKRYSSLMVAKNIIANKCQYAEIKGNEISASKGSFGGYDWNFIDFDFYNQSFYLVHFSSYHTTRELAKYKFDSLLRALSNKYGDPYNSSDDYEDITRLWITPESQISCTLSINKSESKGGDVYWYVDLSYYDKYLLVQSKLQDEDEL